MNKQPRHRGEREAIAHALRRIRKVVRENAAEMALDPTDAAEGVAYLLADIRHFCHTAGVDYYKCAERAYGYYRDERNLPTFNLNVFSVLPDGDFYEAA